MLRRYIEHRERKWHNIDTNRFPRPFEWGIEHLGLANGADPLETLERFADDAVDNSDSFFSYEPTTSYEFDGSTLKFPSAVPK